ncbi:unnamed protein product [Brugia timori]|uniref:Uncharacterized protein n=1 Tax=Brugia timori TaxID=42155 RepID=A0A3P7WK37_9BILA|nr:unnamed protein product [Brugia timori]
MYQKNSLEMMVTLDHQDHLGHAVLRVLEVILGYVENKGLEVIPVLLVITLYHYHMVYSQWWYHFYLLFISGQFHSFDLCEMIIRLNHLIAY